MAEASANIAVEPSSDSVAVEAAKKLLHRRLRVAVTDGRVFIGRLQCLDRQANLILYDVSEYKAKAADSDDRSITSSSSPLQDDTIAIADNGYAGSSSVLPLGDPSSTSHTSGTLVSDSNGQQPLASSQLVEQRRLGLALIPGVHCVSCEAECNAAEQMMFNLRL